MTGQRASDRDQSEHDRPLALSVVKGQPTDEELVAVLAVLSARRMVAPAPPQPTTTGGWSAYWRAVRAPLAPGPDAWRSSARLP